jgi:hypothetical protein
VKTKGPRGPSQIVVREILCHVVECPDAKDTADGIHRFWLSKDALNRGSKEVRDALEFLVSTKGWLIETKLGSTETLYSVAKDHLEEIKDFCAAPEADE